MNSLRQKNSKTALIYLVRKAYTSVEGNEDSGDEVEQCHPEFSDKEILKALDRVYDVDDRNTDDIAASRAIYRRQRELRNKMVGTYRQTSIESYFHKIIRCILDTLATSSSTEYGMIGPDILNITLIEYEPVHGRYSIVGEYCR